jgi:hypothetical protein
MTEADYSGELQLSYIYIQRDYRFSPVSSYDPTECSGMVSCPEPSNTNPNPMV